MAHRDQQTDVNGIGAQAESASLKFFEPGRSLISRGGFGSTPRPARKAPDSAELLRRELGPPLVDLLRLARFAANAEDVPESLRGVLEQLGLAAERCRGAVARVLAVSSAAA